MRVIIKGNDKTKIAHEVAKVMVTPYHNRCLVQFTLGKTPKMFSYEGDANDVLYAEVVNTTLDKFTEVASVSEFEGMSDLDAEVRAFVRAFVTFYGDECAVKLLAPYISASDVFCLANYKTAKLKADYATIKKVITNYVSKNPVHFNCLRSYVLKKLHEKAASKYDSKFCEVLGYIVVGDIERYTKSGVTAFDIFYKLENI